MPPVESDAPGRAGFQGWLVSVYFSFQAGKVSDLNVSSQARVGLFVSAMTMSVEAGASK